MITFNSTTLYYLGCAMICLVIIAIILLLVSVKRLINRHEAIIEGMHALEYQLNLENEKLSNMENDLCLVRTRNFQ